MKKLTFSYTWSSDLDWLIRLRWLAVASQLGLLVFSDLVLEIELPLFPLLSLIAMLALSNLTLAVADAQHIKISPPIVGMILVFDTILLSALLYCTGGPFNPFSVLFLVHIALAAVVLGTIWTWLLTILSSACFALLFVFHVPLAMETQHHHHSSELSLHLYGMLAAFVFTAVVIAYFLSKLTIRLRTREAELRELQHQKLTNQRLASLATLSAGAAHELSTPLSTITLVAKELEDSIKSLDTIPLDMIEDATLITKEVERCRAIINRMGGQSSELKGELPSSISVSHLFANLKAELKPERQSLLELNSEANDIEFSLPQIGLQQTLLALIRNSFDASPAEEKVKLSVEKNSSGLTFIVEDKGKGISQENISRIGEPFFTTKEAGSGMGLGIFLANMFAEHWGGTLSIDSLTGIGTKVTLYLPTISQKEQKYA